MTKVDGGGYTLGPDVAYKGSQYMSLSNSNDVLLKNFTISCPTTVNFSGYFANRPNGSYTNWTGRIDILNASNAVIASSNTQAFTNTTPKDIWYQLNGTSASLPIGDYKYRISLGREGNFDDGYMCVTAASCAVLPVSLKSFSVTKVSKGALLAWSSAQEQNSANYIVQHSVDAISWQAVGMVTAAGNSNIERSYSFVHEEVLKGNNYYRLQQNDLDGKQSMSDIKLINYGVNPAQFSIRQQTAGGRRMDLNISSPQTIKIFSGDGRLMLQKNYPTGSHVILLDKYSAGVYLLSNGQKTERFLIQ